MSVWVAGISAAVTVGAALYSSNQQKQAAKGAAAAQTNAANQANQTQISIYDQNRQDQAPWRNAGANSVGYLSYLMGVPGYESWKPGDYSAVPQNGTSSTGSSTSAGKSGYNLLTGFGNHVTSPGGILGYSGIGGDPLGVLGIGFSAHPQGSETPAGQTSSGAPQMGLKQQPGGGRDTGFFGRNGMKLQMYQSPSDPNFQMLPSGTHFLGPDGIERVKH